jgi:acyl-coenzyme A thioesterase PaaI-like protein
LRHPLDIIAMFAALWLLAAMVLDAPDDPTGPFANSPFARCLSIRIGDGGTLAMPFSPKIIGNPMLPAIHGGMTGAFLETAAIVGVTRELGVAPPKPIGLTINYLRSGRALDSHASVSIVKQGRRVVAFEAQAWQDDRSKPIASAFGHFMLRQTPGACRSMKCPNAEAIGLARSSCQAWASKATMRMPCLTIETLA